MERREDPQSLGQSILDSSLPSRPLLSAAPPAPYPLHYSFSSTSNASTASSTHKFPDEEDTEEGSDDGYDSDATLDLDHAASSPLAAAFLQDAPPLRRMSRNYERAVLCLLSQGSGIAYACACSHEVFEGQPRAWNVGKCRDEDEDGDEMIEKDHDSDTDTDEEIEEFYFFDVTSDGSVFIGGILESIFMQIDDISAAIYSKSSDEHFDVCHDVGAFDDARKDRLDSGSVTGALRHLSEF